MINVRCEINLREFWKIARNPINKVSGRYKYYTIEIAIIEGHLYENRRYGKSLFRTGSSDVSFVFLFSFLFFVTTRRMLIHLKDMQGPIKKKLPCAIKNSHYQSKCNFELTCKKANNFLNRNRQHSYGCGSSIS